MESGHSVLSGHAVGKGGVQVFIHLMYQALCQVRCHALAGRPVTAMQRHARQHVHRQAVRFGILHLLKQTAGTLRHPGGRGIGRTDERSGQRRFRHIQRMGRLAEQGVRQGVDADDLAAERHQIQIGFQNLILAPTGFQFPGSTGLCQFLRQAARRAGGSLQGRVQQTGQLHRQRRCAARAFVPQVAPCRCRHGPPVHAAVFMKAPILRQQQGHPERRRSIAQRHPGAPAHLKVGAQPVQDLAMTIQQQRLGRPEAAANRLEVRQRPPRLGTDGSRRRHHAKPQQQPGGPASRHHASPAGQRVAPSVRGDDADASSTSCTVIVALGSSPNISGA